MGRSTSREVEVKLRYDSAGAARAGLERLGARMVQPREFEDNVAFDHEREPFVTEGKLLRVRRYGERSWLTAKVPVEGNHRHKVMEERETQVADPDGTHQILGHLGFVPCYRYQKYRTIFELGDLTICLDETPLGCFVELEGQPEEIDRTAERLGFGPADYVLENYRALHEAEAAKRGERAGDLVFPGAANEPRS